MKYKLLVLDVDGTLLNDAKEISKRTLAALLKVQQMGSTYCAGVRQTDLWPDAAGQDARTWKLWRFYPFL